MKRKSLSVRELIFKRDYYICYLCHKRKDKQELEVDHLIPYSKGGTHTLQNLMTACRPCNRSKRANIDYKLAMDYMMDDPEEDAIWINTEISKLDSKYVAFAVIQALERKIELKKGRPNE